LSASLLLLALDVAALVCAVLLGVRVVASGARSPAARLVAAIMLCNACHILLTRYEYGAWAPPAYRIDVGGWRPVLNLARNLTPGLIMALSHSLFTDGRRFPRWLLGLFALQVFLDEPIRWLVPAHEQPGWANSAAAGLQALFAGAAIYWALASWRADLIEARRRLRIATVLVIGLDVLGSSLLLRVVIPGDSRANYIAHVAFIAVNLALVAFVLLRFPGDEIARRLAPDAVKPVRPRPTSPAEAQTAAALAKLVSLMEAERVYREPGLSLKALADRVGLPEYRLRKLIHERLGHRNFNVFLHTYRIGEACEQLGDPALRRTPILTIALSVGYQSVNTFNRGFGEIMGVTPSAYRAQADLSQADLSQAGRRAETASKTQ
jgi:AraC-like DNA-binding protein